MSSLGFPAPARPWTTNSLSSRSTVAAYRLMVRRSFQIAAQQLGTAQTVSDARIRKMLSP